MKIVKKSKSKIVIKKRMKLNHSQLLKFLFSIYCRRGVVTEYEAVKLGVDPKQLTSAVWHEVRAMVRNWHRAEAQKRNDDVRSGKSFSTWLILEGDFDYDPSLNKAFAQEIYDCKYSSEAMRAKMLPLLPKRSDSPEPSKSIPKPAESKPGAEEMVSFSDSGKRAKIFGFSVRSILHWMGQDGFTYKEAKKVFKELKIDMLEASIKVGLSESENEKRAIPADLSKQQRVQIYNLLK